MTLTKLMKTYTEDSLTDTALKIYCKYDAGVARDLLKGICLNSSSKEIQKTGMEYLYMNGDFYDLDRLIEKNRESNHPSNRIWGQVYRFMFDLLMQRTSPERTLQYINHFTTRYTSQEPEIQFLIELLKEYCYYYLRKFNRIGNLLVTYEKYLEKMEDRILMNFFKGRVYQLLIIFHMARNELIMARKYAYKALNIDNSLLMNVVVHTHLGLSYTFDAYEKGIYHLKKAYHLSDEHEIMIYNHRLENDYIPFLSAKFQRVEGIHSPNKAEQAHIEIAKGNLDKALFLLEQIDIQTPLHIYYLGLAKQDKDILLYSYNEYIEKSNDFFFSRLPLDAMDS